ncbi:MAG: PD-(D/E)XK nuclease family protein [Thermoanaerobaculia bacterium]
MPPAPISLHFGRYHDLTTPLAEHIESLRPAGDSLARHLAHPVELIVPSRAAATAVARALLARYPAGVAGIELRTPEGFALALLQRTGRYPRLAGESHQRLAMIAAAKRAKAPLRAVDGLAPLLQRSWRDVRDSDLSIEELRARAPRGSRPKINSLTEVWQRYEGSIRAAGLLDPADLLRESAWSIERGGMDPRRQIVFGFYDLTGLQQKLLFALYRAGALDSFWIPIPLVEGAIAPGYDYARPLIDSLDRLGRSAGNEPEQHDHTSSGRASFAISGHPAQPREVREVVSRIRAMIDGGTPATEIAVVARSVDDRLAALMAREARAFRLEITPRRGRRLAAHPWGRAVLDLLRIRRERFHREVIVSLAAAPFRKGTIPDGVHAADLDDAARRAEIPGGNSARIRRMVPSVVPWLQARIELLAETVAAFERMSRGTDEPKRASMWAEWLERITDSLRFRIEEDLAAAESLAGLAELLRMPALTETTLDALELAALLGSLPDLPAETPAEESVWFGDLMSFRGRSFTHVFGVAMQQEEFPQRRSEDVLLVNDDRRTLGVREIADGREEERLLFELLRDGATGTLHLSYSAGDGIRRSWRPSMFLKDLALGTAADEAERSRIVRSFDRWVAGQETGSASASSTPDQAAARIVSGGDASHLLSRQLRLVTASGTRSVHDGHLSPSPSFETAIASRLLELSPRRVETFGVCPHRFFLETVLRIADVEEPEWELELTQRRRGLLEHRILERFYRNLPETDLLAMAGEEGLLPASKERLRDLLDSEFDQHERQYPAASALLRRIERKLALRILERFLVRDMNDLAARDLRPRWFELSFGSSGRDEREPDFPPVSIEVGGSEIRLRGRIDRVDISPDGKRIRVVDYKTGKGNRQARIEEKIEKGHALQLPLYALAAGSIFGAAPSAISAAILPIRSDADAERFTFELAFVHEILLDHLGRLARSARSGLFPAIPGGDCDWCAVGRWCRVRHTREEARLVRPFEAMSYLRLLEEAPE